MWTIEVAELDRMFGSLEGGYFLQAHSEQQLNEFIDELKEIIKDEDLTDDFPFHSISWCVTSA